MVEVIVNDFFKRYTLGAIGANGRIPVDISENDKNQHKYFNDIFIINNSGTTLEFRFDNDTEKIIPVPAKLAVSLTFKDDNLKFTNLYVEEVDGVAVDANLVRVVISKKRIIDTSAGD